MAHKFESPITLPRFSTEEFEKKRAEYAAAHGYQVHIPAFDEIFKWYVIKEPDAMEVALWKKKDIATLGEKRYSDISTLFAQKRARYERILQSPSPAWLRNASSALTFIDDVNDTLGTLGVVARTIAHVLPKTLSKVAMGPAGWLFLAADVTNVAMMIARIPLKMLGALVGDVSPLAMALTPLPYKTRRLQHELHATLRNHPFSKKARLRRIEKLKRLRLSVPELIEGLQTTDNMFGYGLCLGPIMGLLYDIPSGLYHHIKGETVTITGLPTPLLWFDRIWSNAMKSIVELYYGFPPILDEELDKAAVAFNMGTQVMQTVHGQIAAFDLYPDIEGVQLRPRVPEHPSTREVISEYGNDPDKQVGWPSTDTFYIDASHHWENNREEIASSVRKWMVRGKDSSQTMVAAQNAVAAGQMALANLCGVEALEWEYEPVTATLLKLYNEGYTFPPTVELEDVQAWAAHITKLAMSDGTVDIRVALDIAKYEHNFYFTTEIPERPKVVITIPVDSPDHPLEKLRLWYANQIRVTLKQIADLPDPPPPGVLAILKARLSKTAQWLERYGYPAPIT